MNCIVIIYKWNVCEQTNVFLAFIGVMVMMSITFDECSFIHIRNTHIITICKSITPTTIGKTGTWKYVKMELSNNISNKWLNHKKLFIFRLFHYSVCSFVQSSLSIILKRKFLGCSTFAYWNNLMNHEYFHTFIFINRIDDGKCQYYWVFVPLLAFKE